MAYVLNIVMKFLERYWFPNSENAVLKKTKRGCCVFLSIFLIIGAGTLIVRIVLPELIHAASVVALELPEYFENLQQWILGHDALFPSITDKIGHMEIDWQDVFQRFFTHATSGISSILNSAFLFVTELLGSVVNIVIGLIFSIYILMNKEKLKRQAYTLEHVYLKEKTINIINKFVESAHLCFTHFISGQCIEAVILGSLCTIGMFIFRFPYAPMVGTFIGATALIPIVGAYLGAVVGAFLIFTVSPIKAFGFIIFIVILQQLEGNLIYPKVVGASIGLPGMWVLAAVTIGGGLAGIPGMFLGVPLTATAYRLICLDVRSRKQKNQDYQNDDQEDKKIQENVGTEE